MKKNIRKFIYVVLLFIIVALMQNHVCKAAKKQFGIMIANEDGTYSFYDLNLEKGNQRIEIKNKKVMVPLRKICSYFYNIDYNFDFSNGVATIKNTTTGNVLKLFAQKNYGYLYKKNSTKATKVKFSARIYKSADSNALMVPKDTLKYILKVKTGYQYYNAKEIVAAGYDSSLYQGIIVYNSTQKVKSLAKATKVHYVPEQIATNVVKVSIPEGYSIAQIVERLTQNGVCVSSKALYEAMEQTNYREYEIFDGRKLDETVCFPLEGYIYPSTYEFYKNTSPENVVKKFLQISNQKLLPYKKQAKKKGFTLEEILKIASIIEKETGKKQEMEKVSSVLHNRLKKKWKIQCDATIYYVERYIKPFITGDVNRYNAFYNTYKCKELPAGPICNPSENAIKAALNPYKVDYLYFATDRYGNYYYAYTDEEWEEMKKTIEEKNAE